MAKSNLLPTDFVIYHRVGSCVSIIDEGKDLLQSFSNLVFMTQAIYINCETKSLLLNNRVIVAHSEYRLSGPDQMVQHAVGGVPGAVRGRIRGLLQERRDRRS